MKTLILSILALAVLAAGTGKRNYEWPHATQWYGYFTQDSSGGVTQAVSKTVAESTLTGDGFALKRNIWDTLTANVRGWQTTSGHVDSARAAYEADTAKKAKYADSANLATLATVAKSAWNADNLNGYAAGNYVKYSDSTQQYSTTASAFTTYYGAGGSSYGWKVTTRAFGSWTLDYGAVGGSPARKFEVGATGGITADTFNGRFKGTSDSSKATYKADTAKTAAFAYAATYGDTSRAAKVADSAKKIPVTGTAGTYRSVTTDAYGRVISGTTPTTLGPGYGVSYGDTVLANHYLRKDTAQTFTGALSQNGVGVWRGMPGHESDISAFFGGGVTPTTLNHAFAFSNIGTTAYINGTALCGLAINDSWIAKATSTGFSVVGKLSATGIYAASYETLTAAGAVSLAVDNTFVNSSSTITVTLANGGTAGQRKTISNFSPTAVILVSYSGGTNSTTLTLGPYTSATWVSNGTYWAKQ